MTKRVVSWYNVRMGKHYNPYFSRENQDRVNQEAGRLKNERQGSRNELKENLKRVGALGGIALSLAGAAVGLNQWSGDDHEAAAEECLEAVTGKKNIDLVPDENGRLQLVPKLMDKQIACNRNGQNPDKALEDLDGLSLAR